MTQDHSTASQSPIFFTKQPILDTKRSIWGYELLGGEQKEGIYEILPQQESVASLFSSAYLGLQEAMQRGKKIMVGFDEASIMTGVPHALPPSCGVVRVLPGEIRTCGFDAALQELRRQGYQTVMEIMPGMLLSADACAGADIFAFDLSLGKADQASLNQMQTSHALMMARGVKSVEQFQAARDIGFSLFQGPFFKEPEYVRDRKLASNMVSRLNLLRLMETEDPDVKAVGAAIRTDVSISFRLLAYLNSPWFGLRQNIQSIDQAIRMLGWLKLKSWLRAVLIVDMAGKDEVPQELAALSLQRAKFFELLTTYYDYWGFNPGTLFLMGLLSLMDAILGMPMINLVELLPLDAKLKAALTGDANNEYRPLFRLMECLEDADWPTLEVLTQKLFMDIGQVKDIFAHARDWGAGFFESPV
ncbi:MAG: HDOD domain-containing protein [Syntrophobacteraceae bacterium]|jgi:EAL and modified HD-GYP domain-containing signal transduction protein